MFQRYMLTKEIIDSVRTEKKFRILDVGGDLGVISEFLPNDDTYVIDLKVYKIPNFIRADCEFLPFRRQVFHVVTTIDMLEHITRAKRLPVVDELLRVSKRFVLIAAPFDSSDVRTADKTLYNYSVQELKREDPNLREHIFHGLPDLKELRNFLDSKNLTHLEFSNGYLGNWLTMQMLIFHISTSEEVYYTVNELYNSIFYPADNREPSYRKAVLIDKVSGGKRELSAKTKIIRRRENLAHLFEQPGSLASLRKFVEVFERQLQLKDSHIGELEAKLKEVDGQLQLKDSHIGELEAKLKEVDNSLAWKLVKRYRGINNRWFPSGTARRRIIDRFALALGLALDEGLRSLLRRAFDRYRRFHGYQEWLRNNELTEEEVVRMRLEVSQFAYKPKISLVMPVYDTDAKWLRRAIDSVMSQIYPHWELCIVDDASTRVYVREILEEYAAKDERIKVGYLSQNCGISKASNEALAIATGEFVGFLDHDDELTSDALFEVARLLNSDPTFDLIYSDEDKKDLSGRRVQPFFKPDWSPDLFLSMNYVCHLTVIRKSLVERAGGFRVGFEGSQDYDLVLRVTEMTEKIGHIQRPLYSWRMVPGSAASSATAKPYARESAKKALREALQRRGVKGEVLDGFDGYYRIKYEIHGTPLVTIIIATRDRVDLLRRCLASIESNTSYTNYEIIIVDNNSSDPNTISYLESVKHRVIKYDGVFNFSKINNFAAKYAKGEHLLFLNNDTEVTEENWLAAMLEHSTRPEVGMVGSLLLYSSDSHFRSGRIQHAGVILGVGGVAGHAFKYLPVGQANYFDLHRVIRNYSAVTAACAMIRRSVFNEVGGFDENLRVAFGDIDLCLRVREKGYRIVYTPYAVLYHHESATRGGLHPAADEAYMIRRWGDAFIKGDPYYNPNLTHLREDYSIAPKGSVIPPLAVLLDIYYLRPDLQKAYPEAKKGNYRRLIQWAATHGITNDTVRVVLRPYGSYYTAIASAR